MRTKSEVTGWPDSTQYSIIGFFFPSALYLPFSNKKLFVKLIEGIMISVNNVLKPFALWRYTSYASLSP